MQTGLKHGQIDLLPVPVKVGVEMSQLEPQFRTAERGDVEARGGLLADDTLGQVLMTNLLFNHYLNVVLVLCPGGVLLTLKLHKLWDSLFRR